MACRKLLAGESPVADRTDSVAAVQAVARRVGTGVGEFCLCLSWRFSIRSTEAMTSSDPRSIRAILRSALTQAMKQRDRESAGVYRAALGAIDNAGAIPIGDEHRAGAIEVSAAGVGRTEVARRALTEQDMVDIVHGEARERTAGAELLQTANPARARQLNSEANLLLVLIHAPEAD